jgi:hypothetical protein
MVALAVRQRVAARELTDWHEDVAGGIGSRIVLLKVPPGWGRSTVLDSFAETISPADGDPVTFLFRVGGKTLPDGRGSQAAVVRGLLADASASHPVAGALGLDRPTGVAALGLGVGSLFVPWFGALVGILGAQEALAAAGNLRDASEAGQVAALARAARAAAQVAAQVPVVVLIDDADYLDLDLALTLLESLTFRDDGMMLVVAAVNPDGALVRTLRKGDRYSLARRVFTVDVNPEMSPQARTALVRKLRPGLDDALARWIGQRTATFAEVFAVVSAELRPSLDPACAAAVVDAVIDVVLRRPEPSLAAVVVSWSGGVVHAQQLARALAVAGQTVPGADRDIERSGAGGGSIVRLADPASQRRARTGARAVRGTHACDQTQVWPEAPEYLDLQTPACLLHRVGG